MKGFDGTFVVKWLVENGIKPKTIVNGTKIMSLEALLEKWHAKQEGEFNFQKELLEYCRNDVDILRRSMMKF